MAGMPSKALRVDYRLQKEEDGLAFIRFRRPGDIASLRICFKN
jgi:hypothetical protein